MLYLVIVTAILAASVSEGSRTNCPISCYCRDVPTDDADQTSSSVFTSVTCTNITIIDRLPNTTSSLSLKSIPSDVTFQTLLDDLTNVSQHLPYFTELCLSGCLLDTLEDVSFFGLECLRLLDLSHNLITVLPSLTSDLQVQLSNLTQLQILDLSCNRIQVIKNDSLSEFPNLKTLNLSANHISNLSANGFVYLKKLEYLDLSSNNLSAIGGSVFSQTTQLQYLNLSNNKIETLEGDCFSRLTHLQQLDVSRNQLTSVEPSALQALPSLARLTLAGNPHLGDLLVGTGRRLQAVDASRTGLAHVPPALTRSVRTLRLAGNAIHTVRCGDLDSYPLLQLLDFTANGLESIEDDALGRLDTLFMLYLTENNLHMIPKSLPTSLKILHLEQNKIEQLNVGQLNGLNNLEVLLLSDNDISILEEGVFDEVTSLVTLDISGNPLIELGGGALTGPTRLQVLRLAGLPVATAARDTAFPVHAPERLVSLDLTASPGLTRMLLADAAALSAARYLQELSLADAGLVHIRFDLLKFLPQLRSLRLAGNRLDCSGLLWLARWLRQQNREEDSAVLCAAPPNLAGTLLIDLQEGDIIPEVETTKSTSSYVTNEFTSATLLTQRIESNHSSNSSSPHPDEIFRVIIENENIVNNTIIIDDVNTTMGKPGDAAKIDLSINSETENAITETNSSGKAHSQYIKAINIIIPTISAAELTVAHMLPNETMVKQQEQPQDNLYPIISRLVTNQTNSNVSQLESSIIYERLEHKKNVIKVSDTHVENNNNTANAVMLKYMNRSFNANESTSAKILRDLFITYEPTIFNNSKTIKAKGIVNYTHVNEVNEQRSRVGTERILTTTLKPVMTQSSTSNVEIMVAEPPTPGGVRRADVATLLHSDETTVRLKAVSEPRFILSPVAAIKASHDTSSAVHHAADENVTVATGNMMSMYRRTTDGLKEDFSQHPGMLVLIAGVLGASVALLLAISRWGRRRRRYIPAMPADMVHGGIEQDGIEVNHLPGVTDLW